MIEYEHDKLEKKLMDLISQGEINYKNETNKRMSTFENDVKLETHMLQERITTIKQQIDLKYIEDMKELAFNLADIERKCQSFTKNCITTYSEQLKCKDTINKQSSSSRAGTKKGNSI